MQTLRRFRNAHAGRRGFVIGTGMSVSIVVNEFGLRPSLLASEIVVGCKQAHRLFPLRYFVSMDAPFVHREAEALAGSPFVKFVTDAIETVPTNARDDTLVPLSASLRPRSGVVVPTGFEDIRTDGDTGLVALQVAYLLGLDPIYVLGLGDRLHEGRLHFHGESKRVRSQDTVSAMAGDLLPLVSELVAAGVAIRSCSPISNINTIVPYVDIRNVTRGEEDAT
ncbi:hypothetical protein [Salinarimonas ramus]|uniref:Uncharacterized protein n=1 Tax=Salinarimonas ramus TaxID=690164 RepID=A0A917QBN5_9HYPH|nr:hypothetical protein [Salinarimonas ramus]GGK42843.1 hypothetical protein GCM10011322_32380 [Salinarimonas ramus]